MSRRHGIASFLASLLVTAILQAQEAAPPQSNVVATPSPATAAAPANSSASLTPAAAAPATPAARAPRAVPVLLSATDSHGSPVLSLTKEQLTILDSNQAVEALKLYKGSELPLHLGIVLVCNARTFSQQQAAAVDLVNKVIRPGLDEAFVVTARCKKPWPAGALSL